MGWTRNKREALQKRVIEKKIVKRNLETNFCGVNYINRIMLQ